MTIPYDVIEDVIDTWCQEHYYSNFLVTLSIEGTLCVEYLYFEMGDPNWPDPHFVWENDWWEGQKDIKLIGFIDVGSVYVSGTPDDYKFITTEE